MEITVRAYDVAIGLRCDDPSLVDQLAERLPPGATPVPPGQVSHWFRIAREPARPGGPAPWTLYEDDERVTSQFRVAPLLDELETAIRQRIGVTSPSRVFVHAGVVGWQGRAIVIPGMSGAGKTTLVAALVDAGASYGSDEYAVLDPAGLIHAYPRRLSLREVPLRRVRVDAVHDLGGQLMADPLPAGLVVHTRFRDGSTWEPVGEAAGSSLVRVLGNTLGVRERPELALAMLTAAFGSTPAVVGDRGDAVEAARAILAYASSLFPHHVQDT